MSSRKKKEMSSRDLLKMILKNLKGFRTRVWQQKWQSWKRKFRKRPRWKHENTCIRSINSILGITKKKTHKVERNIIYHLSNCMY